MEKKLRQNELSSATTIKSRASRRSLPVIHSVFSVGMVRSRCLIFMRLLVCIHKTLLADDDERCTTQHKATFIASTKLNCIHFQSKWPWISVVACLAQSNKRWLSASPLAELEQSVNLRRIANQAKNISDFFWESKQHKLSNFHETITCVGWNSSPSLFTVWNFKAIFFRRVVKFHRTVGHSYAKLKFDSTAGKSTWRELSREL